MTHSAISEVTFRAVGMQNPRPYEHDRGTKQYLVLPRWRRLVAAALANAAEAARR